MKRACYFLIMAVLIPFSARASEITVTVSIAPLRYFVEQVGGDRVQVEVFVPPGASPVTYEPRPRQMVELAGSTLFIAAGVPFERAWMQRIQGVNSQLAIVRSATGIKLMPMQEHHHEDQGASGRTAHHDSDHSYDPHVWNSPKRCEIMAGTILAALIQADPAGSSVYRANHTLLVKKIRDVDRQIRTLLSGLEGLHFMVYHPSWGYFAQDYGLVQVPVELEGKEPGPRELAEVIKLALRENIKVIFAQPQFSSRSAKTVADAIGGTVVVVDPLSTDWENNMIKVATQVAEALK